MSRFRLLSLLAGLLFITVVATPARSAPGDDIVREYRYGTRHSTPERLAALTNLIFQGDSGGGREGPPGKRMPITRKGARFVLPEKIQKAAPDLIGTVTAEIDPDDPNMVLVKSFAKNWPPVKNVLDTIELENEKVQVNLTIATVQRQDSARLAAKLRELSTRQMPTTAPSFGMEAFTFKGGPKDVFESLAGDKPKISSEPVFVTVNHHLMIIAIGTDGSAEVPLDGPLTASAKAQIGQPALLLDVMPHEFSGREYLIHIATEVPLRDNETMNSRSMDKHTFTGQSGELAVSMRREECIVLAGGQLHRSGGSDYILILTFPRPPEREDWE